MQQFDELFDAAVVAYRQPLVSAIQAMTDARSPEAFCVAERELVGLARELAADMTQRVVQTISDDAVRRAEVLARVRACASERGIEVFALHR